MQHWIEKVFSYETLVFHRATTDGSIFQALFSLWGDRSIGQLTTVATAEMQWLALNCAHIQQILMNSMIHHRFKHTFMSDVILPKLLLAWKTNKQLLVIIRKVQSLSSTSTSDVMGQHRRYYFQSNPCVFKYKNMPGELQEQRNERKPNILWS